MRILFSNDDGIDAPGLHALVAAFRESAHELLVVAPEEEQSGASAALGDFHLAEAIDYREPDLAVFADTRAIALRGSPALCVWCACEGAFGPPPDLVVAGVNAGANFGRSILHSGTVGAVLTGGSFGCSGLAVSLMASRKPPHWETAARLARQACEWMMGQPRGTLLNLNVPNRSDAELMGIEAAPLSAIGAVQTRLEDDGQGRVRVHQSRATPEPGSDAALVLDGRASLTSLDPPGGRAAASAAEALAAHARTGA